MMALGVAASILSHSIGIALSENATRLKVCAGPRFGKNGTRAKTSSRKIHRGKFDSRERGAGRGSRRKKLVFDAEDRWIGPLIFRRIFWIPFAKCTLAVGSKRR